MDMTLGGFGFGAERLMQDASTRRRLGLGLAWGWDRVVSAHGCGDGESDGGCCW